MTEYQAQLPSKQSLPTLYEFEEIDNNKKKKVFKGIVVVIF